MANPEWPGLELLQLSGGLIIRGFLCSQAMIFINYRHEDSKAEVTHLFSRLVDRYGEPHVFVDFRNIKPGAKWPDEIERRVVESSVVIVVVGRCTFSEGAQETGPFEA